MEFVTTALFNMSTENSFYIRLILPSKETLSLTTLQVIWQCSESCNAKTQLVELIASQLELRRQFKLSIHTQSHNLCMFYKHMEI